MHTTDDTRPVYGTPARPEPTGYTLTLSERQARVTAEALEFYTRWCIGQFDVPAVIEFRTTAKQYRQQRGLPDYPPPAKREPLDELRREYFPELSGPGHSYGVGWNEKREQQEAQIGYEIYKAILHEFHKNAGHWNVHSSPNSLHYSDQPVPVFAKVTEPAP